MATVMLLIVGVAALGVLLTRWETVHRSRPSGSTAS
jgi:hypothetical protein